MGADESSDFSRAIDTVRAAGFRVTAEDLIGLTFSELQRGFTFLDYAWELKMARLLGARHTLAKPFAMRELLGTVEDVFKSGAR